MRILATIKGKLYVYCRGRHTPGDVERMCMTGIYHPLPPAPVKHWFSPAEYEDRQEWKPTSRSKVTTALKSLEDYATIAVRSPEEPCGFVHLSPDKMVLRLE
jgi:hypothetical protein